MTGMTLFFGTTEGGVKIEIEEKSFNKFNSAVGYQMDSLTFEP